MWQGTTFTDLFTCLPAQCSVDDLAALCTQVGPDCLGFSTLGTLKRLATPVGSPEVSARTDFAAAPCAGFYAKQSGAQNSPMHACAVHAADCWEAKQTTLVKRPPASGPARLASPFVWEQALHWQCSQPSGALDSRGMGE